VTSGAPSLRRCGDDPQPAETSEHLYRREGPRLLRAFRREVGADEAADLVQESFLRLVSRGQGPDPVQSPTGYLKRIAANLLRNPREIARRRRHGLLVPLEEEHHAGQDPVACLEARDLLQRVERGIAKLKPRTRAIFLAHRVEGLSYAQIAERTGLSVKGVEKQMSKALAELDRLVHR
jgi:RNA polymerase sigma factor (sigma-70 family)